jgi:hypothetical protein
MGGVERVELRPLRLGPLSSSSCERFSETVNCQIPGATFRQGGRGRTTVLGEDGVGHCCGIASVITCTLTFRITVVAEVRHLQCILFTEGIHLCSMMLIINNCCEFFRLLGYYAA